MRIKNEPLYFSDDKLKVDELGALVAELFVTSVSPKIGRDVWSQID